MKIKLKIHRFARLAYNYSTKTFTIEYADGGDKWEQKEGDSYHYYWRNEMTKGDETQNENKT